MMVWSIPMISRPSTVFSRWKARELLLKRIAELNALWKLQQLKGMSIYAESFKNMALSPLRTATGLVTDPVQTVKGVGTGVGNFFTRVGAAVTSRDPDKDELLKAALGQAAYKREFAFKLGVDPYTRYEPLQKELTAVSWTAAAGGLTVKAAFTAIPVVGGAVVSLFETGDAMKELVRDKTPPEIEKINRKSLYDMDVVDHLQVPSCQARLTVPRKRPSSLERWQAWPG